MTTDNWITIIAALATPVFAFLGIVAQAYFANRTKKDKNDQTKEIKDAIEGNTQEIREIKERLAVNDMATVSSVRQQIRKLYYARLPYKTISTVDFRALDEMYTAYKAVTLPDGHHPNSWCDSLYNEMCTWEKVEIYPEHIRCVKSTNKKGTK